MSNQNNQGQSSQANDFFASLLSVPSPAHSSSAPQTSNPSPPGFSPFQNIPVNPFGQQQFYNPYGFSPVPPQFANQQFQQQFQPTSQPTFDTEVQNEADVEPVEEVGTRNKGKRVCVKWTDEEAKILAERWVDASENPTQGNSQTEESFWRTILSSFNKLVSVPRNKNQLTGKWNKIRLDVKAFAAILKRYEQNRPSGADDRAVYNAAHRNFKTQMNKPFAYELCYEVLKDYPKFWNDYGVTTSHRRQIQNDPMCLLDEVEPTTDPNPTPNPTPLPGMESLFRDDPIRRPPAGRDASRKSQRTTSSSDATSSRHSTEEVLADVGAAARAQQEALKALRDSAKQKQLCKAFAILNTPTAKGLSKRERRRVELAKEHMWKLYGPEFGGAAAAEVYDGDDDDDE